MIYYCKIEKRKRKRKRNPNIVTMKHRNCISRIDVQKLNIFQMLICCFLYFNGFGFFLFSENDVNLISDSFPIKQKIGVDKYIFENRRRAFFFINIPSLNIVLLVSTYMICMYYKLIISNYSWNHESISIVNLIYSRRIPIYSIHYIYEKSYNVCYINLWKLLQWDLFNNYKLKLNQ